MVIVIRARGNCSKDYADYDKRYGLEKRPHCENVECPSPVQMLVDKSIELPFQNDCLR
jgi:hypothetical protein